MRVAAAARASRRCVFFVLVALTVPPVRGILRTSGVDDTSGLAGLQAEGVAQAEAMSLAARVDEGAVPAVEVFKAKWTWFQQESLLGKTKRKGARTKYNVAIDGLDMKMVVGIFSTMDDVAYRAVIRSTWMQQRWVCPVEDMEKSDTTHCKIFATFVVGKREEAMYMASKRGGEPGITTETGLAGPTNATETDLTVLDVPESVDCGKTWAWFNYSLDAYRHAGVTHIAKMDMDAWLDVNRFLSIFGGDFHPHCENTYGGRVWHCPNPDYCPPKSCSAPVGTDFKKYKIGHSKCWCYMQGGFYFMSRPLVERIAQEEGVWHQDSMKCWPEDAVAGKAVADFVQSRRSHHACVAVLNLLGLEAIWHADFPEYWLRPELPA